VTTFLINAIWEYITQNYSHIDPKGAKNMSFKSWLYAVGEDFKKGLDFILPWAETAGEAAVSIFAPALGPMFNSTVTAVAQAEQNFSALGKQTGSGPQKLAAVVGIVGGLIKKGLEDAGKSATDTDVQNYINAVVAILNAAPGAGSKALDHGPVSGLSLIHSWKIGAEYRCGLGEIWL